MNVVSTNLTLHRYIGASILRFTYGCSVEDDDDRLVYAMGHVVYALIDSQALVPGAYLADMFPICKWPSHHDVLHPMLGVH